MKSRRSLVAAGLGFGAVLIAASTLGVAQIRSEDDARPPQRTAAVESASIGATSGAPRAGGIAGRGSRGGAAIFCGYTRWARRPVEPRPTTA